MKLSHSQFELIQNRFRQQIRMKEGKTALLEMRWTQGLDSLLKTDGARDKAKKKMLQTCMTVSKELRRKVLRAYLF